MIYLDDFLSECIFDCIVLDEEVLRVHCKQIVE